MFRIRMGGSLPILALVGLCAVGHASCSLWNRSSGNKITFRYNQLASSTDTLLSTSSSLGIGRNSGNSTNFLGFKNSNYTILENIHSGVGEGAGGILLDSMAVLAIVAWRVDENPSGSRAGGESDNLTIC